MNSATCKCGHEKRDHRMLVLALQGYGECKVCLCDAYAKVEAPHLNVAAKQAAATTTATGELLAALQVHKSSAS